MEGGSSPAARGEAHHERTPLESFERIYLDHHDPWRYASSAHEHAKYDRTLAVLGARRYGRALELGCSIGVFTARLAGRCDAVVALEPSPTALARARERLKAVPNIELLNASAPESLPDGPFDLVVCSEVLYYLGERLLLETLRELERRIAPGGVLVAVHFRANRGRWNVARLLTAPVLRAAGRGRPTPRAPLSGDAVHELLRSHTRLVLTHEERHGGYRLDRFDSVG
jgi:SAM-dependent methyltransferase